MGKPGLFLLIKLLAATPPELASVGSLAYSPGLAPYLLIMPDPGFCPLEPTTVGLFGKKSGNLPTALLR